MRAALSAAIEAANHKAVSRASKVLDPFFIICILSFWWKWRKNVSLSGTKVCLASKWLQHNNRRIDTNFKGGYDSFEQWFEFHRRHKLYILFSPEIWGGDISTSPPGEKAFCGREIRGWDRADVRRACWWQLTSPGQFCMEVDQIYLIYINDIKTHFL